MSRISGFFSFIIVLLFNYCNAQDIHFSTVKVPEELGVSGILAITQDAQGFLWLGTQSGLFKYDGYQYTPYLSQPLNPNALQSNYIECVAAAKDGSIWIGHYGLGLGVERLDPKTGIFTHYVHQANDPNSIASDSTAVILQDHEGMIWMGTKQGLDRFNPTTNTFTHYKHDPKDSSSLSYDGVRALYEDREQNLWIGTGNPFYSETSGSDGGLNKLDKTGKFTRYLHKENDPHSLIDNRIRAIFEDSRGNFWVGTAGDGLHTMNRQTGSFDRHLFDPAHPDKLSRPPVQKTFTYATDFISFITEDNSGRIWIGSFEGGINVWDPATQNLSHFGNDKKSKETLQDEFFWTAYKSKDGVLWITPWQNNILYKVNPYEAHVPHVTVSDIIFAFTEDNAGKLWLAGRGLLTQDSAGKWQRILLDKNPNSNGNSVHFITKGTGNQLWLATSGGLYSFDAVTHEIHSYRHDNGNPNSLPNDSVNIIKNSDQGLWVSTNKGLGLLDPKTGIFKNYLPDPNDSNSIGGRFLGEMVSESNGDLWVASYNGLNRLDKTTGHFKKYLGAQSIYSMLRDSEGNLWVATNGNIYRYNEQRDIFMQYTDAVGLLKQGSFVYDMIEDKDKHIWFNTSKGVVELDMRTKTTNLYGINQNVDARQTTNWLYTDKNGDVLAGDTSGYFYFNDQQLKKNVPAPIVNITRFSLADSMTSSVGADVSYRLDQQKDIRLSHNQNVFSIQFSSLDFISQHEDTRLLYMLENYDQTWRPGNNEQTAYYFNVPPGRYVFKVKAANAYGIWAQNEITIIINPPWWTTWWAYCLYAVCFLCVAFFANRIIRNRIIEKERMKTREKELSQAREIEKAYNELKITQAQLIQSEKMASLGELTAGIAHEIQNPLNFVNNFSEVNKELLAELGAEIEKGNYEGVRTIAKDVSSNEEKISHHGKRADAIVKGMLQHSRTSKGVKEPTDINGLCDEYLRLSYHGLRAKDSSFNAKIKTDYDQTIGTFNLVPQDIGRVLLNLYNNAFYAINQKQKEKQKQKQSGGDYDPTITVSTKKNDHHIEIRIADNGDGIPQAIIDKIFQPFYTTKPTGEGTGLGLSLSYDIIKTHGGEINLETEKKEGTTFIIQLPMN